MRRSLHKSVFQLIAIAFVFGLAVAYAPAQEIRDPFPSIRQDQKQEGSTIGNIEDEMLARRAVKAADKAHKENVERAKELATLCSALKANFETSKQLDKDDFKKLERAEKLAKKIREAAGGSGDEVELERQPSDVAAALARSTEVAESLRNKVENTPKHVVNAAVIDEANVLLELIRLVRLMHPKV